MLVDNAIVLAIEQALAESARHYARVKASVDPDGGASFVDIAGGALIDGGRDSGPNVGRAWGMGIDAVIDDAVLDQIAQFDALRERPSRMVLCPFVSDECLRRVIGRGFQIERYEAVLAGPADIAAAAPENSAIAIEPVDETELRRFWSVYEDVVAGLALTEESVQRMNAPFFVPPCQSFLCSEAGADGRVVAASAVIVSATVAHLLAAVVKVDARGRGLQRALIARRAAWAKAQGASIVMATCAPRSASFVNLQRAGLRVVYTSTALVRRS